MSHFLNISVMLVFCTNGIFVACTTSIQIVFSQQISDASRPVVTMQEEPFVSCEHNLLEHVYFMQNNIESQLGLIEEQISGD